MSFRERLFLDKLATWDVKKTLHRIFLKRRTTLWGPTPIVLRVRKYKFGGEIRQE